MIKALMSEFVPELRRRGFRGSFPHFKRMSKRALHLLSVQFKRDGGAFVVEIAAAPLSGIKYKSGWQIPADEVNVGHTARRLRLGASRIGDDHWFSYETGWIMPLTDPYSDVAQNVVPYVESQAEPWWADAELEFFP